MLAEAADQLAIRADRAPEDKEQGSDCNLYPDFRFMNDRETTQRVANPDSCNQQEQNSKHDNSVLEPVHDSDRSGVIHTIGLMFNG